MVMTHHVGFRVAGVNRGFKYHDLLFGKDGTLQSADEFFRFTGKHTAANHLNPALLFSLSCRMVC